MSVARPDAVANSAYMNNPYKENTKTSGSTSTLSLTSWEIPEKRSKSPYQLIGGIRYESDIAPEVGIAKEYNLMKVRQGELRMIESTKKEGQSHV